MRQGDEVDGRRLGWKTWIREAVEGWVRGKAGEIEEKGEGKGRRR